MAAQGRGMWGIAWAFAGVGGLTSYQLDNSVQTFAPSPPS